jgi:hypothetical protein
MSEAKCRNCGTVVKSITRHDWSCCKCFDSENPCTRGFYLDGGKDYIRFGGNYDDVEWIDPKLEN